MFLKNNHITVFFLSLIAPFFCHAQQMVQKPKDIFIVCQKENLFIGKPLKVLLKELKPPIKIVFAEGGWSEQAPQFHFFFMSKQEFDNCRRQAKLPLRLNVYVKEFFQWYEIRSKDQYVVWEKADEEKYGDLIITAIRVAGECDPCETRPHFNL